MTPPGWDEEEEDEESAWMDDYDDEFAEEEGMGDEEEDFLDDEYGEFDDDESNGDDEDEDELESLIDEGEALIEEADYQGALELFREAVERFPESAEAAFKLGSTALMIFTDGVETSPNWEDDDDLVGFYEDAVNGFDAALSIDPEDYQIFNGLGAVYMMADNLEAAIENWERSLELNAEQEDILEAIEEARAQLED